MLSANALCVLIAATLAAAAAPHDALDRDLVTLDAPCHFVQDATGKAADWTWNPSCYAPTSDMVAPYAWVTKYPTCGGVRQSPIDIITAAAELNCYPQAGIQTGMTHSAGECTFAELETELAHGLELSYKECELEHPGASPSMVVDGKTYMVLQMHFHGASEHTMDGVYSDAELHIVHANVDDPKDLVVLGIMVNEVEGVDASEPLEAEIYKWYTLLNHAAIKKAGLGRKTEGEARRMTFVEFDEEEVADVYSLLPEDASYYTYLGSLTTPPCSEIVTWVVLDTPIVVSANQLWWFRASLKMAAGPYLTPYGGNNRPTQPLNGRIVSKC